MEPVTSILPLARERMARPIFWIRYGPRNVGVDHVSHGIEILIQKSPPQTVPGIREKSVHRSVTQQPVDTVVRGKISLHRFDVDAMLAEALRRRIDREFIGGDDEIETSLRAEIREVIADA